MTIAEKIAAFPTLDLALVRCPERETHTASPRGYFEAEEWAERMLKTHRQKRCGGCGRYLIWEPK